MNMEKSLLKADLIVMTSPAYVFHATGAMKAFLDHFAYRWLPHRPAPEMFGKRAVIITQCLGAGAKSAAKDMKHSLSWWGVSKIGVFTGALMGDIVWEKLSEKKQTQLTRKVKRLSQKSAHINYAKPAHTNLITKFRFSFCRVMQKSLHKSDPEYLDGKSIEEQPDLLDVPLHYEKNGGAFWKAVEKNEVIGTIAFMNYGSGNAVLKKFFVRSDWRNRKIGYALYEKLITCLKDGEYKRVLLDTPSVATASHRFYEKAGSRKIPKENLPFRYEYPDRDSYLYLLEL